MNKFQIENLDFCQSTGNGSAKIITGAFGEVDVDVDAGVESLLLVEGTTVVIAAAVGGAIAASIGRGNQARAFVLTEVFGSIS